MDNDHTYSSKDRGDVPTGDQAERSLPVTAEVGGEGGSYADPTNQAATFHEGLDRKEGDGGDSSVAAYAIGRAEIGGGGAGSNPDPAHGMIRYPSEAPGSKVAAPDPSHSGVNWRGGVIGAVAGFAGAALVGGLTRRRSRKRT
jgi:hypothetical protein